MTRRFHTGMLLLLTGVLSGGATQALAQADAHGHDEDAHAHAGHMTDEALRLNGTEPWETDEPLRHNMTQIRAAVDMLTPVFEAGQLSSEQARQLGEVVMGSVNTMIEECALAPEADANLHIILGHLLVAAGELDAAPQSPAGLPALKAALDTYGHYFQHPGWEGDAHDAHAH